MLTKFSVKNFRNFSTRLTFDLSSQSYEFNSNAVNDGYIQHSIVYGPNGGGKSNLGLAMVDPVSHIVESPFVMPSLNSNYLNAGPNGGIAEFEFEFKIDNEKVVYQYGKKSRTQLVYESLSISEKRVLHIDRRSSTKAEINLPGTEHLKADVGNSEISLIKYIKSNAILDNDKISNTFSSLINFIEGMVFFRSLSTDTKRDYVGKDLGVPRFSQGIINNSEGIAGFENFLNDLGIECKLSIDTISNGEKGIFFDYGREKLEFGNAASTGTISLGILYYWLLRLSTDDVTFAYIDEFDAFYHHALAYKMAERISSTSCQTVMTTHNTGVMSNDLLRPDCYFVLDKTIKPLSLLTSKELRKAHNLEKIYKGLSS